METFKPDIVKVDCEGCEEYLADVPKETLRIPEMYIIEHHALPDTVLKLHMVVSGLEIIGKLEWAATNIYNLFEFTKIEIIIYKKIKYTPEMDKYLDSVSGAIPFTY